MKPKHTAGPWVPEYDLDGFPCVVTVDKPFEHICTVANAKLPDAELAANARLIALGPDMLQWLVFVRDEVELELEVKTRIGNLIKKVIGDENEND